MNTPMLAVINNSDTGISVAATVLIVTVIIILAIWDGVWKLIALWKSARNDQLAWFICLAIFNTVGILPILYILAFQKKATSAPAASTP